MQVAATFTISESERAFGQISRSSGAEPLSLPMHPRHLVGGAESALAQVIISWAQRNPKGTLKTFITTKDQAETFVRRLPGLVAALCASRVRGLSGESIFTELRNASLYRMNQLLSDRPKEGYRGPSAEIVCADHLGLDCPYLLYQPSPSGEAQLRPRENFRELARWLLRSAIPVALQAHMDLVEAGDAIGSMLFEIFKNTVDHARADVAGNILDVSIRAIKTNYHSLLPERLESIVGDFQPLSDYCASLNPPRGAAHVDIFELSILDSGPGFAPTWTGKTYEQLSAKEEEEATRACFGGGSAKGQDRFGEGLPHVMRVLQRHRGFLRLRTGRLSFFVDFTSETQQADMAALRRYDSPGDPELAPTSGSLLSILIPMRRKA